MRVIKTCKWGLLTLILGMGVIIHAQATCEAFIEASLSLMQTACTDQDTLTACFGNGTVILDLAEGATVDAFADPGDSIPLETIAVLQTAPLNVEAGAWGIVRLLPEVGSTDTTLTLIVMGDVMLENMGQAAEDGPSIIAQVASNQGVNVRETPNVVADMVEPVFTGTPLRLTAIYVTDQSDWVRVEFADGRVGWAAAVAFNSNDLEGLPIVTNASIPAYGSMQAMTLTTSATDRSNCDMLPSNGVLVQSPEGEDSARIAVNDVPIIVAPETTLFLSIEDDVLRVDVLEGQADMPVTTAPLTVRDGEGILFRAGELPIPNPYDYGTVALLPLDRLPRQTFAALNFDTLLTSSDAENPLEGIGAEDDCTIATLIQAANLRQSPAPDARVRHVMQIGTIATPDGRTQGSDGVLWWRLAENVWVSSNAVAAVGDCGTLPVLSNRR